MTDFDTQKRGAQIDPSDVDEGIFENTSRDSAVTADRLYTSQYDSGATVSTITDPST